MAAVAAGEVVAAVHQAGACLLDVRLPSTALASSNIQQLKKQTMEFMTEYMKQQNMDAGEVDLMEEVVSDDDGEGGASGKPAAGGKKRGKGQKRKQQETPKT